MSSNSGARNGTSELTLGDLLYADRDKARIAESEWHDLVLEMAKGDETALQGLYERTHRLVFTLAVRITRNREQAEEVTADVFHAVWQRAAAYDPADGPVVGWVMNQARSKAIDRLRYEQRRKRVNPYPNDPSDESSADDPMRFAATAQDNRSLDDALQTLTPVERQTIETAFFGEMTYSEAAATLNQPLGTIKTRIRSALTKLRQTLTKGATNGDPTRSR